MKERSVEQPSVATPAEQDAYMISVEKSWRIAKTAETICCDKCGAVGVLVDTRTQGRTWIVDWRCAYCGDTWFTRDPQRTGYQHA